MRKSKRFDYNDLSTWGIIPLFLIAIIIIGVIGVIAHKLVIQDKIIQIESLDKKIGSDKIILQQKIKEVALLPEKRQQVEELKETLIVAKKILPTNISMPALINDVYNSARNNGIVFSNFTPEADIKQKFYTAKPISLSSNVGFLNMASFIQEVTSLERIMNVESVSFRAANDDRGEKPNQPLEMTAQLRTYVFNEEE